MRRIKTEVEKNPESFSVRSVQTVANWTEDVVESVELEYTLQSECHWNTELLVHLAFMERVEMEHEGTTVLLELMYFIETAGDKIVPVNIGEQIEENQIGRKRIALVKQSSI